MIEQALWPREHLPRLVEALGRRAGLAPHAGHPSRAGIEEIAESLGMEAAPIDVRAFQLESKIRANAPAILEAPGGYLGIQDNRVTLLKPDLTIVRVSMDALRDHLCEELEAPHRAGMQELVKSCGLDAAAGRTLLRERIKFRRVAMLYSLRRPPGAPFQETLRQAGIRSQLAALLTCHTAEYLLLIGAWWVLGRAVLQGQVDTGILGAWALLLASIIPFRIAASSLQGTLAISLGGLLRERLLDGALKLHPEELRQEGAGAFLGRAIEAEQVESAAVTGGTVAGLSLLETFISLFVLALGPSSVLQFAVLALWIAATILIARRYHLRRGIWTGHRLQMTGKLIEAMTGHRTRLAQQPPEEWHTEEDRDIETYTALGRALDQAQVWLGAIPRAYLVTALLALAPDFLGSQPSSGSLAASLGAIIIAWQAFRRIVGGFAMISGAVLSWQRVSNLFHASSRNEPTAREAAAESALVVSARDVGFQYRAGARQVFSGVNLDVRAGDWLLLEGPSGGGKSTLVSVLAALRPPSNGLMLAGGLDVHTLGARHWRKRIAAAPQYHENHVLGNTFAFNLLMGRNWPPTESDLREANDVCEELGLGPLLERMPAGLFQLVGETGWQLSQGERSRLFLARALLQHPELVILDESFAALDPETLQQALECALRRAKTLLVVAHP